jgi:hypothetical protein
MLRQDSAQAEYAASYANKTTQYGGYAFFRTHATDLYLLAYQVDHPNNKNISLANKLISDVFLGKLNFRGSEHWRFVKEIAAGDVGVGRASSYLYRLESQLKIRDARYKQWRRLIANWKNISESQRQLTVSAIFHEHRRIARAAELVPALSNMMKYRTFKPQSPPAKSMVSRLPAAAAGAVAGRYIGGKVATSLDKDVDKYKNIGTGLGAVAGYWASGRTRK